MDGKTDYMVIIFNKMDHWLTHIYQYYIVYVTPKNLTIYTLTG